MLSKFNHSTLNSIFLTLLIFSLIYLLTYVVSHHHFEFKNFGWFSFSLRPSCGRYLIFDISDWCAFLSFSRLYIKILMLLSYNGKIKWMTLSKQFLWSMEKNFFIVIHRFVDGVYQYSKKGEKI